MSKPGPYIDKFWCVNDSYIPRALELVQWIPSAGNEKTEAFGATPLDSYVHQKCFCFCHWQVEVVILVSDDIMETIPMDRFCNQENKVTKDQ